MISPLCVASVRAYRAHEMNYARVTETVSTTNHVSHACECDAQTVMLPCARICARPWISRDRSVSDAVNQLPVSETAADDGVAHVSPLSPRAKCESDERGYWTKLEQT